nr:hypothetical protein GCM10025732_02720 [Glycomyces mayteni]
MITRIRKNLGGLKYALAVTARAHPKAAAGQIVLGLVQAALLPTTVYLTKVIIDSVQAGHTRDAWLAAAGLGLGVALIWTVVFAYVKLVFLVFDHTARASDREIMELMGTPPGLDHHERPGHLDQVQRIREDRGLLGGAVNWLAQFLRGLVTIAVGGALLLAVHPLLLVFPLVSLGAMAIAKRAGDIEVKVQEATSEPERRRRHLFEVATLAESGKELRVFGSAPKSPAATTTPAPKSSPNATAASGRPRASPPAKASSPPSAWPPASASSSTSRSAARPPPETSSSSSASSAWSPTPPAPSASRPRSSSAPASSAPA